jgi:U3 small nucleolar RNA-associated protein 7
MITLDADFVGSLAQAPIAPTHDGKKVVETSFARLPRLERLRVQGKADDILKRLVHFI